MPQTAAEQFADTLAAAGIKRIRGIVGDRLNGLTDVIRRQPQRAEQEVRSLVTEMQQACW